MFWYEANCRFWWSVLVATERRSITQIPPSLAVLPTSASHIFSLILSSVFISSRKIPPTIIQFQFFPFLEGSVSILSYKILFTTRKRQRNIVNLFLCLLFLHRYWTREFDFIHKLSFLSLLKIQASFSIVYKIKFYHILYF